MRETEASPNEVTSSVDNTARTRWPEFKPKLSGSLCSENESVEKINQWCYLFLALQVIWGSPAEGDGYIA